MEPIHFPLLFWLTCLVLIAGGITRAVIQPAFRKSLITGVVIAAMLPFVASLVINQSLKKEDVLQILGTCNILPTDEINVSKRYRTDGRGWMKEITDPKGGNWTFDAELSESDINKAVNNLKIEPFYGQQAYVMVDALNGKGQYTADFRQDNDYVRWTFYYDNHKILHSCRIKFVHGTNKLSIYYSADPDIFKWLAV